MTGRATSLQDLAWIEDRNLQLEFCRPRDAKEKLLLLAAGAIPQRWHCEQCKRAGDGSAWNNRQIGQLIERLGFFAVDPLTIPALGPFPLYSRRSTGLPDVEQYSLPPADLARLAILLDVDGTILDLAPTPREVFVPHSLRDTLARLSERTGGGVAFVSGRPINELDLIFAPLQLPAIGGHGAELRMSPERRPHRRACRRSTPS